MRSPPSPAMRTSLVGAATGGCGRASAQSVVSALLLLVADFFPLRGQHRVVVVGVGRAIAVLPAARHEGTAKGRDGRRGPRDGDALRGEIKCTAG